jgi:hypothetical protein
VDLLLFTVKTDDSIKITLSLGRIRVDSAPIKVDIETVLLAEGWIRRRVRAENRL